MARRVRLPASAFAFRFLASFPCLRLRSRSLRPAAGPPFSPVSCCCRPVVAGGSRSPVSCMTPVPSYSCTTPLPPAAMLSVRATCAPAPVWCADCCGASLWLAGCVRSRLASTGAPPPSLWSAAWLGELGRRARRRTGACAAERACGRVPAVGHDTAHRRDATRATRRRKAIEQHVYQHGTRTNTHPENGTVAHGRARRHNICQTHTQ